MEGFEIFQDPKVILTAVFCFGGLIGFICSGFTIVIDYFYMLLNERIKEKKNRNKE